MKLKALALMATLATQVSFAQEIKNARATWTYNDHWENTQIEFEQTIYGTVNQATCTKSIKQFMGCVAVLNKSYELMYPERNLLVIYAPESKDTEFAPFDVIEYADIDKKEFFKVKKEYFQNLYLEYKDIDLTRAVVNFNSAKILNNFTEKMVTEANDQMMAGELYNEYLALAYDPHTYIMPTSYLEDRAKPNVQRKGIGIYFHPETLGSEQVYVLDEVIPNSPAEKFGLIAGDMLLKANAAEGLENVYKVISEEETILFDILRGDETLQITVEKDFYEVSQVQTSIVSRDNKNYGYIKLRTFTDNTACARIKDAGKKMLKEKVEGIILDLRNNGGGLVTQMQCIVGLYLENGSRTWAVKYLDQETPELIEEIAHRTDNIFGDLHTITLINARSASASEATSMYLKDYRKSFIVGERSFGKGSMQGVGPTAENPRISKGSTQALYYGPKGISPQVQGVEPDFVAYPKIDQKEATPMSHEADEYLFVIENDVKQEDLVEADRKEEIATINGCIQKENRIQSRYAQAEKAKKLIFDNQLETGLEVLRCANENVAIYKGIDIPVAKGVEFIDRMEYFFRTMPKRELKPIPVKPITIPIKLKTK